jgi:hypothetical protein
MKAKKIISVTGAVIIILCYIIIMLFSSCAETAYLSRVGYVSEINQKTGIYTVYFPCENQRYRNQKCGAWLPYRMDTTVTLMQKFEIK